MDIVLDFNPHFYLLRVRNSSIGEFFYRLRQSLALYRLRWIAKRAGHVLQPPEQGKLAIASLSMPDLISDGKHGQLQDVEATPPDCLHNQQAFGGTSAALDIRVLWEPARLQRATLLLAHAAVACKQADHADSSEAQGDAKAMIMSWLCANPFPQGIHYKSAMECGLRIPVFFYALKQIQRLTPLESNQLLGAIYRHALLVSKKLSLHSSLGNHTICEAVGLIFAGAIYQFTPEGRRWLEAGIELLDGELPHQILADGGPAEQSLNYHRFVLDLYWLAADFIHKNDLGDVSAWQPRLMRGESFLDAFKDHTGHWPSIGDSDDGFAVAPGIVPARCAGSKIGRYGAIFENSGYSIIRTGKLVFSFDHGPLGLAPLYNHGHADALSITLSMKGHPLLVDPGTYRYNGVPRWRRYFKGTRAHNTVNIDDQDQAVQETGFIWSKPYTAKLTAFESEGDDLFFEAVHDGYMRLISPVRHQRSVYFFNKENFTIKDRFFGKDVHCFQINFHLHPNAAAIFDGKWWIIDHGGERIYIRLLEGDFQSVRGRTNPLMGWFSSHYGQKEPTSTLTFTQTGEADGVVFTTVICTGSSLDDQPIDIRMGDVEQQIGNS
jgi:hypothetical protein